MVGKVDWITIKVSWGGYYGCMATGGRLLDYRFVEE
jgi:hypothetical protein